MKENNEILKVFPPGIVAYILATQKAMGCPIEYVIGGVLAALSIAIGGKIRIMIKLGWHEGPCLFIMVIGPPGSKKTPSLMAGLKPIIELQIKLAKDKTYIVTTDATSEALFALLALNGVLLYKDELASLWKGMNQYKSSGDDMERFLNLWTQLLISSHRKGSDPILINNPYLVTIGGLQTGLVPDFFALKDNGLRDRFLVIAPDEAKAVHSDDEIPESVYEKYKSMIWWIYQTQNASEAQVIKFSAKAKEVWTAWHIEYCDRMNNDDIPYNMQGVYSKMEAYTARLSLVLEYAYCAEENRVITEVSERSISNAIILSDYFLSQAQKVYNSYGTNVFNKKVSDLISWLKTRPNKEATAREVYSYNVAGIKNAEAAYDLFTMLHNDGLAILFTTKLPNGKYSHTIKLRIKQTQSNN